MIGRFAIDADALSLPNGAGLGARIEHKRLAESVLEYGLLGVLGPSDADKLSAAMERLAGQLGYDFWRPLMRAIDSAGPGVFRARPPHNRSVHDYAVAGDLEQLRAVVDLLVLADSSDRTPGLTPTVERALYDDDGFASFANGPELALASAVDQSQTVHRVKALQRETIIPAGTLRNAVWDTYFRPLARVSTEVNIFDRFLFSGLLKTSKFNGNASLLLWLLSSLDRDLPRSATVNLFARSGDRVAAENHDKTAQPYSVGNISDAVKKLRGWKRDGRLHLYLDDSLDHDRHFRFSCGHAIMSQGGFDRLRFNREGALLKPFSYAHVPPGDGLDQRAAVEAKARMNGSHWILKAKATGFEPAPA